MMWSRLIDVEPAPDVFAAVMATGIVSIAAQYHQYHWVSTALAVVAATVLALLIAFVATNLLVRHRFVFTDLRNPDVVVRLFTFAAACAVLGVRFTGYPVVVWTLGLTAWLAWLVLAALAAWDMWPYRWADLRDRAHGGWELASVATSGSAIVIAHLTLHSRQVGVLSVALAMWILAIGIYCVMTSLILWRAAAGRGFYDWEPDSWILMGGLAIVTLAGDHIHRAARALGVADSLADGIRWVTQVTWVVATLWIPVLVYVGLRRILRHTGVLRFAGVWWAMVFPLGMYSAATQAMSMETGWRWLQTISLVFFWIALVAWVMVGLGGSHALRRAQTR